MLDTHAKEGNLKFPDTCEHIWYKNNPFFSKSKKFFLKKMRETASITHERHIYNYIGHFPAPAFSPSLSPKIQVKSCKFILKFFLFYKKGGNFAI